MKIPIITDEMKSTEPILAVAEPILAVAEPILAVAEPIPKLSKLLKIQQQQNDIFY